MYPNISTYAYCALNPVKFVDPDGRSAVVTRNIKEKTIVVSSNLTMYGAKGSKEMAIKEAKTIQDNWNSAKGKVTIDDIEYSVSFVVTGSYEKSPDISNNQKYENNYMDVMETHPMGSSFIRGVGGHEGVFLTTDLDKIKQQGAMNGDILWG